MNFRALYWKLHRGVFFDPFGPIFFPEDPEVVQAALEETMYRRFVANGLTLSAEMFRLALRRHLGEEGGSSDPTMTPLARRIHRLARRLGLVFSPGQATALADELTATWQSYQQLDPAVHPLLEGLRLAGKRLALVAHFDHPPHLHRELARLGLDRRFDLVLIAETLPTGKPDRTLFEAALDRLQLRASETMFVGTAPREIDGARIAGLTPLQVVRQEEKTAGTEAFPEGGPPRVRNLNELLQALPSPE